MVLLGNVSMIHVGSPCVIPRNISKLRKDTHKKDLTKLSLSVQLSLMFVPLKLRPNLGVIHDKTKCVLVLQSKNPETKLALIMHGKRLNDTQ